MTDTTLEAVAEAIMREEQRSHRHYMSRNDPPSDLDKINPEVREMYLRMASAALSVMGEPVAWRARNNKDTKWVFTDDPRVIKFDPSDWKPLCALPPLPTIGG